MTELILVRHGQTDGNYHKKYCGATDQPLNKTGISQVNCLRKRIDLSGVAAVFTSGYKRAQQTARILFPGREITPVPSLGELNFGSWEGLTYEQVLSRYPDIYKQWLANPYRCTPPQGESLIQLRGRVMRFLEGLLKSHRDKKVVCVSHAGPIRVIICDLLGKKPPEFWTAAVDSASSNTFVFQDSKLISSNLNQ